jgi:hypothetical protein
MVRLDLEKILSEGSDGVWVGLAAATGADYQNHDVLQWSFTPRGDAVTAGTEAVSPGGRAFFAWF